MAKLYYSAMSTLLDPWHASLELVFSRREPGATVLGRRRHEGPLMVQKALYPEGPGICHVALLHPPSGIAGGDRLRMDIRVDEGAHAVLTTPGATRWYKANGRRAAQSVDIRVQAGACLDWLPGENIFFEDADADSRLCVHLSTGARAVGWEITQLGSAGVPGHWMSGRVGLDTALMLDGRPLWLDAGELRADSPLRHGGNGLAGFPVMATLWAFGPALARDQADELGRAQPWGGALRAGLTQRDLPMGQGLILARVLGEHVQEVRRHLIGLWGQLRPLLLGRESAYLRLWNT